MLGALQVRLDVMVRPEKTVEAMVMLCNIDQYSCLLKDSIEGTTHHLPLTATLAESADISV